MDILIFMKKVMTIGITTMVMEDSAVVVSEAESIRRIMAMLIIRVVKKLPLDLNMKKVVRAAPATTKAKKKKKELV